MNQPLSQASIEGMRGDYARYARAQHNAVLNGLQHAAERLVAPLAGEKTARPYVHFVDIGAADGINSFPVVQRFAEVLAPYDEAAPLNLLVSHLDVPDADFRALARNLYAHPRSYRQTLAGVEGLRVRQAMLPCSFYEPYLPAGTADVIFATISLHYASQCPAPVRDHVDPLYATGEEGLAWQSQSVADLERIMGQVHDALRCGGKLWVVAPSHTRDEQGAGIVNHWYREVWTVMIEHLTALREAGDLDEACWLDCTVPAHQRHACQWQDWFASHPDRFALDYLEVREQENPYLESYRHEHGDRERFADDYLASVRAWGDRLLVRLIPDGARRQTFFAALKARFRDDPERFAMDAVTLYLGATKL